MKIILKPHLKIRLKERKIPQTYPARILTKPNAHYFDNLRGRQIAIKELKHKGKLRPMMVAYDIIDKEIQVITIHPESEQEIKNRIISGRWSKYEKV